MALQLKIIAPGNLIPGQQTEFTFDELGGSIGRKPNNDFVLLDPERFISSKHAIIEYNNGKYFITDTSTNGIFINNSKTPLGTGHSAELMNGDKIAIGDYQLLVNLQQTQLNPPQQDAWLQPSAPSAPPASPVPAGNFGFDDDDIVVNDTSRQFDHDIVDPLAILGDGASNNSAPPPPMEPAPSLDADHLMGISGSEQHDILDDLFGGQEMSNPHERIPEPSPLHEPFTPPQAIPDDWDLMADDDLGFNEKFIPDQSLPPTEIVPDPGISNTSAFLDDDDLFSGIVPPPSAAPAVPLSTKPVQKPVIPEVAPPPKAANTFMQSDVVSPLAGTGGDTFFYALCEGMGINPNQVQAKDKVELAKKIGTLLRISTEGVMNTLRARATIKSSFRVNKTTISPIENNPLKFLVTTDDVLQTVLADDRPGYMAAREAFTEGFADIQTHQMAMMAGMQSTINALIARFDPKTLEQAFAAQGGGILPGQKKAKNWDAYTAFYQKISDSLMDDFQNVFGEEFAKAYEAQVNKLR